MPEFEAANAQVVGVSVDFLDAQRAFAEKLGLKYPILSDSRRQVSRAFGVLNDDPALAANPARIGGYMRAKRAWFIIDRQGIIRYAKVEDPRNLAPMEELLAVVKGP